MNTDLNSLCYRYDFKIYLVYLFHKELSLLYNFRKLLIAIFINKFIHNYSIYIACNKLL